MDMSLAVIVPAYNESSFIVRCLEGLLSQTLPALEVLVVDDSSTDDMLEKVADFSQANSSLNVRVVGHQKVGGYDIMGNYTEMLVFGWSNLARGLDYVAICDADTVLSPSYYERVLPAMEANSRVGIAGGELLPEPGMQHWWRNKKLLGAYPYVYGCNRVYRSECWQELLRNQDPVRVLTHVGVDTYHALLARALGWQVLKQTDAISTAMRPPASLVSSRLKGISSFVLGYSLLQIAGRALFNRDSGYLQGWLWAHSQKLPRLAKVQPFVRALFWRRFFQTFAGN